LVFLKFSFDPFRIVGAFKQFNLFIVAKFSLLCISLSLSLTHTLRKRVTVRKKAHKINGNSQEYVLFYVNLYIGRCTNHKMQKCISFSRLTNFYGSFSEINRCGLKISILSQKIARALSLSTRFVLTSIWWRFRLH
jgi:hypothetical protein